MRHSASFAGRALLAILLMIGFYILAFGIMALLAGVFYAEVATGRVNLQLSLFCLVGIALLVWSVFPRVDRFEPPGPALEPTEHPRLFETLRGVAAASGQAMPSEVYLAADVNAWVAQRGGVMGVGSRRVMGLGLPLLQSLTTTQLRAVLAHEFGHFDAGDTRLGPWIHKTRGAIGRTLAILSQRRSVLVLPFRWYGTMFLRTTQAISRWQELAADRLAVRVAGGVALATGLRTIHGLVPAHQAYWMNEVGPVLGAGFRPPLVEGFDHFLNCQNIRTAIAQSVDAELKEVQTDPFDSHPALHDRLAAIDQLPQGPPLPQDDPPAIALLENLAQLEVRLFAVLAANLTGPALRPLAWDRVGTEVYVPSWRAIAGGSRAKALQGVTPLELPANARDLPGVGKRMDAAERLSHSSDERVQRAVALLAAALGLALYESGFAVQALPGEPVRLVRGPESIEPLATIARLANGELAAPEWQARCHGLGIAAVNLMEVAAARRRPAG